MRHLKELFPQTGFPGLLVGLDEGDDAAVYQISDDLAVILTLDFFTPIVDDPFTFGEIAAANAMSDIYAMGGDALLALNIACFPKSFSTETIAQILYGGASKVREAGGALVGGHTVEDDEPKYGLAVMGRINPREVLTKSGAVIGDALVLTKPLGVGIVVTVSKAGECDPAHMDAAIDSMKRLNKTAARIFREVGVHALTDITGFGLIGHALEISKKSGVGLSFSIADIPFIPGARDYADSWLFPGRTNDNLCAYRKDIYPSPDIPDEMIHLLLTPETSGGLLAAIPKKNLEVILERFAKEGEYIRVVGEVVDRPGIHIVP